MITRLIIILTIQGFLFSGGIFAEETKIVSADKPGFDLGALLNLKNPFLSAMPPAPKVEPQKVVPPPPPKPEVIPPPKVIVKPKPSLTVTAVVWGEAEPQAIINGKIIGLGETIEAAKVVSITKKGVQLSFEHDTIDLTVDK